MKAYRVDFNGNICIIADNEKEVEEEFYNFIEDLGEVEE